MKGLLHGMCLEMPPGRVVVDGEDVSHEIRSPEVTQASAAAADSPIVRQRLAAWQRSIAQGRDMVCEGRDQGTIVFPDAGCKFFLFADAEERARRRHREMKSRGHDTPLSAVLESQQARDAHDAGRGIAPMVPADDAISLDTTALTLEQVVAAMEQEVRRRMQPKDER